MLLLLGLHLNKADNVQKLHINCVLLLREKLRCAKDRHTILHKLVIDHYVKLKISFILKDFHICCRCCGKRMNKPYNLSDG